MRGGQKSKVDNTMEDLIIKIIAGLLILVVGLFLFDKFVKKNKVEMDENYEKP